MQKTVKSRNHGLVRFNPWIGLLSGATTPSQSGPGSDGNKRLLRISHSSSITETSLSDCLVSYPGHWLGGGLTPLQRSSRCILQPQPTGQYVTLFDIYNLCTYSISDIINCKQSEVKTLLF